MSLSLEYIVTLPPEKKVDQYCFNYKALLGKGSFSEVYAGFDEDNGNIVAIKIINRKLLLDDYILKSLQQEIDIMKKMSNPNLVRFFSMVTTFNNAYVITEYCNGGDLAGLLERKQRFSEQEAILIMSDILRGMRELIKHKIIHRDLKPANIFINDGVFKIGDFGFAKQLQDRPDSAYNPIVGTPYYMPPQYLQTGKFSIKHDIWSLGVMFYEILYGDIPWPSKDKNHLVYNIYSKPLVFPKNIEVSALTQRFIKNCLEIREENRISWDEIFKSELFFFGNFENKSNGENKKLFKKSSFDNSEGSSVMEIERKTYEEGLKKNPSSKFLENASTNYEEFSKKYSNTLNGDSAFDNHRNNEEFLEINNLSNKNEGPLKLYNFSKKKNFVSENLLKLKSILSFMEFLELLRDLLEFLLNNPIRNLDSFVKAHFIIIKQSAVISLFFSEIENKNILKLEDWEEFKTSSEFLQINNTIQKVNDKALNVFLFINEKPEISELAKYSSNFSKIHKSPIMSENKEFFLIADYIIVSCIKEINDFLITGFNIGPNIILKREDDCLLRILAGFIEYHKILVFSLNNAENYGDEYDYNHIIKEFDFNMICKYIREVDMNWMEYLKLKNKVIDINP